MLSLRVSKEERATLQRVKAERGCRTLSQTMRVLLGFPRVGPAGELEGADDIENVTRLCTLVVVLKDRLDEQHQLLTKIARHLEIPMQERPKASRGYMKNHAPPPPIPIPVNGRGDPDDDDAVFAFRGGRHHPELPDGFARG